MHDAARWGRVAAAKLLLEYGANPNAKAIGGDTPLHHAKQNDRRKAIVRVLLEYGANPNQKNDHGETPVDWAIKGQHEAIARLLLDVGGRLH